MRKWRAFKIGTAMINASELLLYTLSEVSHLEHPAGHELSVVEMDPTQSGATLSHLDQGHVGQVAEGGAAAAAHQLKRLEAAAVAGSLTRNAKTTP